MKKHSISLLFVLLMMAGCQSPEVATIQVNNINAYVEVAATALQRERGLMYRQRLEKDQGLLMIFPEPQQVSLWMLNTAIPLDVGYFDSQGVLLEINRMQPDGGKVLHHSPAETRYVLEMNQGWFNRYGLQSGAKLILPEHFVAR